MTLPDIPPDSFVPAPSGTRSVGATVDIPPPQAAEDSGFALIGGVIALAFVVFLLWRRAANRGQGGGGPAG